MLILLIQLCDDAKYFSKINMTNVYIVLEHLLYWEISNKFLFILSNQFIFIFDESL